IAYCSVNLLLLFSGDLEYLLTIQVIVLFELIIHQLSFSFGLNRIKCNPPMGCRNCQFSRTSVNLLQILQI
ncbi:hypothetical protein GIB67_029005, partial [Kingdonia uniflora]